MESYLCVNISVEGVDILDIEVSNQVKGSGCV